MERQASWANPRWLNSSLGRPCLTQGTDLAECWLVDSPFPPASGDQTSGFYLLGGGYCLVPEAPLIRGMPTGPKVFSALRLDPPLKKPCAILVRWWDGEQIPEQTHVFGTPLQLLGRTSAGRGISCMFPFGWASALEILLASGGRPPRL